MFKTTTIMSAVLALAASSALAQEAQKLERIEVTGSSIKRVDAESALPITTLTREDIVRSGATTSQDLVQGLAASFGGNVVANNVGATGGASTANLRALGPKYTLVLLNGRRVANFAFGNNPVDLNSIPLAAVERVEIVRDGASSTYGADAVAGVINFILRKDYQGVEASWAEYKGQRQQCERGGRLRRLEPRPLQCRADRRQGRGAGAQGQGPQLCQHGGASGPWHQQVLTAQRHSQSELHRHAGE
jgi:iron complex outermembrane receptor protein